ncbi:MAG: hypothetical protein CVU43_20160 [Chloroflexi bacterium HGW-Chloroflexi-5]|nr:MAG: hypothetical protein CVU54_08045 [Deltaproteobacteria bacterium HGW-Deltaproteobacteria-12]PKN96545.1 MAG: hypothetical protein CVU43_20160 [Chloroflexi bacterium HGW-Chloroflexi-5]
MIHQPIQSLLNFLRLVAESKVQAKQTPDAFQRRLIPRSVIGLPAYQRMQCCMKIILPLRRARFIKPFLPGIKSRGCLARLENLKWIITQPHKSTADVTFHPLTPQDDLNFVLYIILSIKCNNTS